MHGVNHNQVYPCLCGRWFRTPQERQRHLDGEAKATAAPRKTR